MSGSRNSIPTDSAKVIIADSIAMAKLDRLSFYKLQMRNNPDWLSKLNAKSFEWHEPLEKVMQADAEWMLERENEQ